MSRYIDMEKLLLDIQHGVKFGQLTIVELIKQQPTVEDIDSAYAHGFTDAESKLLPKHGEWIAVADEIGDFKIMNRRWIKCNQCNEQMMIRLDAPLPNFCPYCGADMRVESQKEKC